MNEFEYQVLGNQMWDECDDNIDVEVALSEGRRYAATFFTPSGIPSFSGVGILLFFRYLVMAGLVPATHVEPIHCPHRTEAAVRRGSPG